MTNASHHDISARENGKYLQAQVGDLRNAMQASAAGTGAQVLTESATIQIRLGQAADELARGQENLDKNLCLTQDNICGQISQSGGTSLQAIGTIRADIRRSNLIHRRNQQRLNRQLRKLNQGRGQLTSMLAQLSSLHLESQKADSPDVAQYPGLENMAFLLIQMRGSLNQLISSLQSNLSLKVSDEEVDFFFQEFERLVTFCTESGTFRGHPYADGDDSQRLGFNESATKPHYSLGIESRPLPKTMQRRYRRRKSHHSPLGRLEVNFEEIIGHFNDLPTTVQRASFHFVPNRDIHSTGVYASFRKDIRMAHRPRLSRSLREIRVIPLDVSRQVVEALCADDLPALQHMLSTGRITPWDRLTHTGIHFYAGGYRIISHLNLIEVR